MRHQSKSKRKQSTIAGEQQLPRIIIEKEEPWLRVQENVNRALAEALEAKLSTLPGGSRGEQAKKLRPLLEKNLAGVRERMWEMTKPNLRVNGFNYEDFVESEYDVAAPLAVSQLTTATEPFDESLDRQIWALNTERVNWETKVVEKRRIKAGEVANLIDDLELRRDAAIWKPSEEDEKREQEMREGELLSASSKSQLTRCSCGKRLIRRDREAGTTRRGAGDVWQSRQRFVQFGRGKLTSIVVTDIRTLRNSWLGQKECRSFAKSCHGYRKDSSDPGF